MVDYWADYFSTLVVVKVSPLKGETTLKLVRQLDGAITTEEIKVLVTEEELKKLEYEFVVEACVVCV